MFCHFFSLLLFLLLLLELNVVLLLLSYDLRIFIIFSQSLLSYLLLRPSNLLFCYFGVFLFFDVEFDRCHFLTSLFVSFSNDSVA